MVLRTRVRRRDAQDLRLRRVRTRPQSNQMHGERTEFKIGEYSGSYIQK